LTSNIFDVVVIDPDLAATVNGNGISTPDVLSIEVRDANILNNDVVTVETDVPVIWTVELQI